MTEPHPEGKHEATFVSFCFCTRTFAEFSLIFMSVICSGAGLSLCIEKALAQAGVAKEDVNYVNAHATSTRAGDLQEYRALMRAFGNNPEVFFFRVS